MQKESSPRHLFPTPLLPPSPWPHHPKVPPCGINVASLRMVQAHPEPASLISWKHTWKLNLHTENTAGQEGNVLAFLNSASVLFRRHHKTLS